MSLLANIVYTTADLIQTAIRYEAKSLVHKIDEEARAVEWGWKRTFLWSGFIAVGIISLIAGIGFIITGIFILLASAIGWGFSALIVGVILCLIAVSLIVALRNSK